MIQRTKRNTSRTNLVISAIFHGVLIMAVFFFAAREGILGKKLKELTVTMVPKEKKPEPPKPEEPKPEPPKTVDAPKAVIPPPRVETAAAPPSAMDAAPAVAPAASVISGFEFNDGAKQVQSISDPNGIYKALVEHTLRNHWNRPEDMADDDFTVEVELHIDAQGQIQDHRWMKGSGDARWDNTVKTALSQTTSISRPPPKGFPDKFVVRFDVESIRTEPLMTSR